MFDQYSYKVKFRALLCITVLLGITAYKRSFSTLIQLVQENTELSNEVSKASGGSNNIKTLETELDAIDRFLGKEGQNKEQIQQNIVAFAAGHNQKPSIYDLSTIHTFKDESFIIHTYQLDVTGTVNQLLSLSYDFEKRFSDSRIVSLNFYTVRKSNNPTILHSKIIFQNYENNK